MTWSNVEMFFGAETISFDALLEVKDSCRTKGRLWGLSLYMIYNKIKR